MTERWKDGQSGWMVIKSGYSFRAFTESKEEAEEIVARLKEEEKCGWFQVYHTEDIVASLKKACGDK